MTLEDLPPAILERNRAVLQAAGLTVAPPAAPPKVSQPRATRATAQAPPRGLMRLEAHILSSIQKVARANGWLGWHSYVTLGPDVGLHLTFIRDVVIFADVQEEGCTPTVSQQQLQQTLQAIASPHIETYCWYPRDFPAIEARLTQPRR